MATYRIDASVNVTVTNTETNNSTNATINLAGTFPCDPAQIQILMLGRMNTAAESIVVAPVA